MPLLGGSSKPSRVDDEQDHPFPESGKTDLLLRFFDSQFFDEWIALTYLYKSNSAGVQDYLCNRLYSLPEKGLERYLSQLCQIIISRPHSSLERVIVDLCARSLRIAVKVYWLLLAISQDQPKNTYVSELRDQCERAALEGYWDLPFKETRLLPLSPSRSRWLVGSPPANGLSSSFRRKNSTKSIQAFSPRFASPEGAHLNPAGSLPERPMSPDGLSGDLNFSSYSMGQGLEGLICASPTAVRTAIREGRDAGLDHRSLSESKASTIQSADKRRKLRLELEDIEHSITSVDSRPPTSAFAQNLPSLEIPADIQQESILSPPSSPRLRQTTFGATLDFIEALCDASAGLTSFSPGDRQFALQRGLEEINKEIDQAGRMGVACWFPMGNKNERIVKLAAKEAVLLNSREKAPFMLCIEVLRDVTEETESNGSQEERPKEDRKLDTDLIELSERSSSHASAGPGPGSDKVESSPRSPRSRLRSFSARTLGSKRTSLASSFRGKAKDDSASTKTTPRGDSFSRGLNQALAGLQGSGPLVSVELEVCNDPLDPNPAPRLDSAFSTAGSLRSLDDRDKLRNLPKGKVGVIYEDDDFVASPPKGFGLLCTWAACRAKSEARDQMTNQPYIKLHIQVHGGVDLRLNSKQNASHRRVPSDEALLRMANHHKVPVPQPRSMLTAASAPPLADHLPSAVSAAESSQELRLPEAPKPASDLLESRGSQIPPGDDYTIQKQVDANAVFGERFWRTRARIMKESPHGRRPGWWVQPVIVKSGDDCRQELLAAQLIKAFHDIFQESQLPLYLRPYEVLVTSNRTALIEMVPDTLSLHQLKAKASLGASLADFFFAKFVKGTPACETAQRNFAESMAAYSIVCYLLQIKDRHNGNILMDDVGHILHIDFGFMLSNSPGNVNFEAAPFKLTRELLEVMDSNAEGRASEMFDYYKVLCIQGFLACRKHADRIILLVEMMQGSGCPCFKAGPRAVAALRKRFHLALPESQCVEVVLGLISDSVDAWRTRQYDQYQRVMNGIL